MRFPHRIDVLAKTTVKNQAGQRLAEWNVEKSNQICHFVPSRANIRISPTAEETEKIMMFVPADAPIDFQTRLSNIHDRSGSLFPHLEGKEFEVIEMNHFSNYRGKPQHIQCRLETVIE